jgi:hypothetical protein
MSFWSNPIDSISGTASQIGSAVDQIPGGWATVAALAAGGAYGAGAFDSVGAGAGAAAGAGTGAAAGAGAATGAGMGLGTGLAISGGLGLAGALIQSNAAKNAANTQANASLAGQQLLQANYRELAPQFNPYLQAGNQGLAELQSQLPSLTQSFGPDQLKSNLAPNYQFMLNQGLGAQNQGLNASGGGSNIGIAGTKFAEDYASNAYQNAFNNYQTQQSNIYNKLSNIAGLGQQSLQNLSNLATGNATNISNLGVGAANAQATGQVGSANAIATGANSIGNNYFLASLLNPANQSGNNQNQPQGS